MKHSFKKILYLIAILTPVMGIGAAKMGLQQAETYAIAHAPEIEQLQAQEASFTQTAIAARRMPDPKLTFGVANLPTDTFSFTQENMTQVQIGLMQQFPRGQTLSIQSRQKLYQALNEREKAELMQLSILQSIRNNWLDLYYWQHAMVIYQKQHSLFSHLAEATESLVANNKAQQKDAVRAQLGLSTLEQKILFAGQKQAEINAQLSRWLDKPHTQFDIRLPKWTKTPSKDILQASLNQHPLMKVDEAMTRISREGVALAKQSYKPEVGVGVVYGIRQGKNTMDANSRRADFVGAQMTLDLPFFTKNLQDRYVNASVQNRLAAEAQARSDYQQLKSQLGVTYAAWHSLKKQNQIYRSKLIPQARQYADATQIAYQNDQTDFPTLIEAYIQSYETELTALASKISEYKMRAELLYLQGL